MRKFFMAFLGLALIAGSIFMAYKIVSNKKKPKPRLNKVVKTVFVQESQNGNIPIIINANGNLSAQRRIELYSEVSGIFKNTGKPFKAGQFYRKGEVLVRIDATEYYANVQSAKSNFYNLLTSIMPDLQIDYPEAYPKWQDYLNRFDMNAPLRPLPEAASEREKYFITGRNIYTTYFNIENLQERLSKFTIRAPFDGILTLASVTEGTLIRNAQKLGEFIDPSVYELEVAVPAAYANMLEIGKGVTLKTIEGDKTYNGKVIRVNASVDRASQTVRAFVEVRGTGLKEGMYLEANLKAKEEPNAIEIARNLLQDNNEVFVVKNDTILNTIQVQPVYFSDKTVVLKGVPDGVKLVSKPVLGAYPGMQVQIFKSEEKASKDSLNANAIQ
ncbi:efflux RND transporter periplasmic adaptor subunit [Sungkyunkwania multivorans]|uniref:Efflux RND transporter periplasmic adaptor subunit n=1 Tax=Sungkyunkwania multivorans TaxID=1173618 RepID=A0ABW3D117_9FLAO